jgi:hypothetical protein
MAQALDLARLVDRLRTASERISSSPAGLCAEVTSTDLVVAAHGTDGGHGRGRTESIPFGILFRDDADRLGEAIDRIETYCAENAAP